MPVWKKPSAVSLLAAHLRGELMRGRWSGRMPGVIKLARETGAARKTVDAALRALEEEGLLIPQGHGRSRLIRLPKRTVKSSLRVALLTSDAASRRISYMVEIQHELAQAGHVAFFPAKNMSDLGMNARRIARMVEHTEADAWVVTSGSHEILQWFASRKLPVFALFGRRRRLPIAGAGPDKPPAYAAVTKALTDLGHRRIVLMARRERRIPEPGASEQAFLDELVKEGISPSTYHLPDWEPTIEGFHGRLETLFQYTPPTALIIDEAPFFVAAMQFLAARNLSVPQDVSLACTDADPVFDWCQPSVAHIHWNSDPMVRRIVRWVANVSIGKEDKRQTLTPAEFIPGGTIGPVKME